MQLSRAGPFLSLRDSCIRQHILSAQRDGIASEIQNCEDFGDQGGEAGAGPDFQEVLEGTQRSTLVPTSTTREQARLDSFEKKILAMFEIAKANWCMSVNDIFALPSVCELYSNFIIRHERKIREQLQSAIDQYCRLCRNPDNFHWHKIQDMLLQHNPKFPNCMTREDSVYVLKIWLISNFTDHADKMLTLPNWFDKRNGKRNTLLLTGPPSCGKSWFAEAILKIGLFKGGILPYAKGGQFCFQETINSRIIMHEECQWPIQSPEYTEQLKAIWGGQQVDVNVKYLSKQRSSGAPVIACCNFTPCQDPRDQAACDVRTWHWRCTKNMDELSAYDYRANVYGGLHPLAVFDVYNYYLTGEYMDNE